MGQEEIDAIREIEVSFYSGEVMKRPKRRFRKLKGGWYRDYKLGLDFQMELPQMTFKQAQDYCKKNNCRLPSVPIIGKDFSS